MDEDLQQYRPEHRNLEQGCSSLALPYVRFHPSLDMLHQQRSQRSCIRRPLHQRPILQPSRQQAHTAVFHRSDDPGTHHLKD